MLLGAVLLAALLVAAAVVARRRTPAPPAPRVFAAAVAPAPSISGVVAPPGRAVRVADPLDTLDALLAELESTTVRLDGADGLDESAVAELERLAARLE